MPRIEFQAAGVVVPLPGDGGERTLLAPTDLVLSEHRIGVIGANGSGKSTMARMLNGLVLPTTGTVLVDDLDVRRNSVAVRRQVGFCFTDPAAQLVMPTCVEDIELSLRRRERNTTRRRELAMAVLTENGLGDHAHDSVHSLSGGQKQMLALAGVLAVEPSVVVADEPTTLLDLANTRRVADLLFAMPQQLVMVTHDLDLAARCDRVLVISDARISFDGAPHEAVEHYVSSVHS